MAQSAVAGIGTGGADGRGSVANPTAEAGRSNPWIVLLVLCLSVFMLLVDTTIVNVAQRKIQTGLDADLTQIQWVLDSYILAYAVLLLSFGRMGDVYGRKKLFVLGMVVFTAASGLCAASAWIGDTLDVSGAGVLIVSRVLQGIGGAFMMPQSLSLLTVAFPAEQRGAAMGIWGSIVALGAVCGPVVGGLIVTHYAWEWVFLINIPIGIFAIWATLRVVPESVDPRASKRFDWGGVALSGLGIFALVYASIEGTKEGWTSPLILGSYAASVLLLALFVWWERRVADPMIRLELFAQRNFTVASIISLVVAFGMFGIFFPMTIFLQGVLDFTPIRAGLTMIPMSLMIMIGAPFAGRMTDRFGARWILVTGLTFVTVGIFFIVNRISLGTDWVRLLPALVVAGLGMGLTFAPMTTAAMAGVPLRFAGSASGVINTTRNIGQVLGIAILGSLLQNRVGAHTTERIDGLALDPATHDRVVTLAEQSRFEQVSSTVAAAPGNTPEMGAQVLTAVRQAFVDGVHDTFTTGAIACAVALAVAFLIRNPAPRQSTQARPMPEPIARPETEPAPVASVAD